MQKFLKEYLEGLNERRAKRRKIRIAELLLVVLVIGTVAGVLSQYGVTLTDAEKCGLAEHKHNGACYENALVCGKKETEAHEHADECYETADILSCGLDETDGHQHDAGCSDEEGNLICEKKEMEPHHHDESCYTEEHTLICQEKSGESHTHTDDCYDRTLICGMEEHAHDSSCYVDKTADVEEPFVWDDMYANTKWRDTWSENLVIAAEKQLAYKESKDNYEVAEDGSHKGYTRYGAFCEDDYCDWDAAFVNFCMHYAGKDDINIEASKMFPKETDAQKWYDEFVKADEGNKDFLMTPAGYEPKAGDLIFFEQEDEKAPLRMGIVSDYDAEKNEFSVIEGNRTDEVKENTYKIKERAQDVSEETATLDVVLAGTVAEEETVVSFLDMTAAEEVYKASLEMAERVAAQSEDAASDDKKEQDSTGEEASVQENEDVLEEEGGLVRVPACGNEDHEHMDECYEEIPREDWERVENVIKMIDELPTYEEIGEALNAYDEAGDDEGYEEYYTQVTHDAGTAYLYYEDLGEELQRFVTNSEALLQLSWLWEAATLDMKDTGKPPYTICTVNRIDWNVYGVVLVYGNGKTVNQAAGNGFIHWNGYSVENQNGTYIVTEKRPAGTSKETVATPTDGFILFFHGEKEEQYIKVGDYVTVDFDYTKVSGTKQSGWGTAYINAELPTPPESIIERNNDLKPINNTVSTKDRIEINLYDFVSGINKKWENNKNYPGFQNPGGSDLAADASSVTQWKYGFGDNITSNLEDGWEGLSGVTPNGDINKVPDGNQPLSMFGEVMQRTLGADGYPALKDGTSLGYLFGGGGDNSVKRMNEDGLDGLFQYDENTGEYKFNSRDNHAQYNPETNKFDLYDAWMSSNYLMYPFGNFLPFNDIQQAAHAKDVDRQYFLDIAARADKKADEESNQTYKKAYVKLSNALRGFVNAMDEEHGTRNWTGEDAANSYLKKASIPLISEEALNKTYSIDYDEETNFYFGMSMEMDFEQPKNGLTGLHNDSPMVFYFTGDDDVWVYLDEYLFLDLSGIHRHVGGKIDFVTGKISYYPFASDWGDIDLINGTTIKEVTFKEVIEEAEKKKGTSAAEITKILDATLKKDESGNYTTFKDNSAHNFKFYYMERGSGSGVCKMNFNFPLLEKNAVTLGKELSVDNDEVEEILGNPDFDFQVLEAKRDGEKPDPEKGEQETLFITEGTAYDIYVKDLVCTNSEKKHKHTDAGGCYQLHCEKDKEAGHAHTSKCYLRDSGKDGIVGAYGIIKLKAGQYAVFPDISVANNGYYVRELFDLSAAEQYGTITSTGESTTHRNDIQVGDKKFSGHESGVSHMLDGSTVFAFDNTIDTTALGSIRLTKHVTSGDLTTETDTDFRFKVALDGEPVKAGTEYIIYEAATGGAIAATRAAVVSEAGIVSLKAGQTIELKNILAGTKYTIQETEASANGYLVSYRVTSDPNGYTKSEIKTDEKGASYVEGMISVQLKPNVLEIEVLNSVDGVTLEIPVQKILSNPDGKKHTYQFELKQVADVSGSALESATPYRESIEVEGTADAKFTLVYDPRNYKPDDPKKLYYQITEVVPDSEEESADEMTVYDKTRYIVEVTVGKTGSGKLNAEISRAWKYESDDDQKGAEVDSEMFTGGFTFMNHLLHDLTIAKVVGKDVVGIAKHREFKFTVTVSGAALVSGQSFEIERGSLVSSDPDGGSENGAATTTSAIEFDADGKAAITLKHEEYLTIKKLPYGADWTVEEIEFPDFFGTPLNQVSGGAISVADALVASTENGWQESITASGALVDETDWVMYVNGVDWESPPGGDYELPSAGGNGIYLYMFSGMLLMFGASLLAYKNKRKEVLRR